MKIEIFDGGRLIRAWAPAKINLFFEIVGKRDDGYHEIETVATPIDLFDRLDFEVVPSASDFSLECYDENGCVDPEVPVDQSNLVFCAYNKFFDNFNKNNRENWGLKVKLFKKIPTKAGLGGGSSDAASVLAVLNLLSGTPCSKERLQELAGQIGCDTPLFLEDGASIGRGRGELVEPVEAPELWLVLLKPQVGLSTPEVYRRYASFSEERKRNSKRSLDVFCSHLKRATELARTATGPTDRSTSRQNFIDEQQQSAAIIAEHISNRLEEPATFLWDGVARRRELLYSVGALGVQMSGSGTAFFAIFPSEASARVAASKLRERIANEYDDEFVGERVYVVKTLSSPTFDR